MRILIHNIIGTSGKKEGEMVVHTDVAPWNKVSGPATAGVPMDMITFINALHKGTIPVAGTGWEQISNHPLYIGKTFLEVCVSEIVRMNDVAARSVLGL